MFLVTCGLKSLKKPCSEFCGVNAKVLLYSLLQFNIVKLITVYYSRVYDITILSNCEILPEYLYSNAWKSKPLKRHVERGSVATGLGTSESILIQQRIIIFQILIR